MNQGTTENPAHIVIDAKPNRGKIKSGYAAAVVMFVFATALQLTYIMSFPGTGSDTAPLVLQDDGETALSVPDKAAIFFSANLFWFLGLVLMASTASLALDYYKVPIIFAYVLAALGAFLAWWAALVRACGG